MAIEQLLFSSVTYADDRPGGWQVLAKTPGITNELLDTLRQSFRVQLGLHNPPGPFPSKEEIHALDRRLTQIPLPHGTAILHVSSAGLDATGRPNSLLHAIVDTNNTELTRWRSVELWQAPWLATAKNQEELRQITLPDAAVIAPHTAVGLETAIKHLFSEEHRGWLELLPSIMDALMHSTAENHAESSIFPGFALVGIDSSHDAAQIIEALNIFIPRICGRQLKFSTYERVHNNSDIINLLNAGYHLVFTPRIDLPNIDVHTIKDIPIFDSASREKQLLTHKDLSPSAWGELARSYLVADPTSLLEINMRVESASAEMTSIESIHPAWPLALEFLDDSNADIEKYPNPGTEQLARDVVISHFPAHLNVHTKQRVLKACQVEDIDDPDGILKILNRGTLNTSSSSTESFLIEKFLNLAFHDPRWITHPSRPQPSESVLDDLHAYVSNIERQNQLSLLRSSLRCVSDDISDNSLPLALACARLISMAFDYGINLRAVIEAELHDPIADIMRLEPRHAGSDDIHPQLDHKEQIESILADLQSTPDRFKLYLGYISFRPKHIPTFPEYHTEFTNWLLQLEKPLWDNNSLPSVYRAIRVDNAASSILHGDESATPLLENLGKYRHAYHLTPQLRNHLSSQLTARMILGPLRKCLDLGSLGLEYLDSCTFTPDSKRVAAELANACSRHPQEYARHRSRIGHYDDLLNRAAKLSWFGEPARERHSVLHFWRILRDMTPSDPVRGKRFIDGLNESITWNIILHAFTCLRNDDDLVPEEILPILNTVVKGNFDTHLRNELPVYDSSELTVKNILVECLVRLYLSSLENDKPPCDQYDYSAFFNGNRKGSLGKRIVVMWWNIHLREYAGEKDRLLEIACGTILERLSGATNASELSIREFLHALEQQSSSVYNTRRIWRTMKGYARES